MTLPTDEQIKERLRAIHNRDAEVTVLRHVEFDDVTYIHATVAWRTWDGFHTVTYDFFDDVLVKANDAHVGVTKLVSKIMEEE
jgi:hypothetical protein